MPEWAQLLAVVVGWIVLSRLILPRLGVGT